MKRPECFGDFNIVVHGCFKKDCKLIEVCRTKLHKHYLRAVKEFNNKKGE